MSDETPKFRYLFVDDEPEILNSLRLTLRKERKRWDLLFAGSGQEALDIIAREPVDGVVSDMQMPGIDGAELLARVRDLCPGACRVVLSGYADEQLAMRALSVAHQFLSKPASRDEIVASLEGTRSIMELVERPEIRGIVGDTTSLPPSPALYTELLAVVRREDCGVEDVAAVVSQDPALCAKFLQIANSAYFALPRTVVRVEEAISYLGFATVTSVVLGNEILQGFKDVTSLHGMSIPSFQRRATFTSRLAVHIASDLRLEEHVVSTAGVLHAVGRLLLESRVPESCDEAWKLASDRDLPLDEAERRVFVTDHATVGGALLGVWGLPTAVVETVVRQHQPTVAGPGKLHATGVLHVAAYLANQILDRAEPETVHVPRKLDYGYLNAAGLANRLQDWNQYATELAEQVLAKGDNRAA